MDFEARFSENSCEFYGFSGNVRDFFGLNFEKTQVDFGVGYVENPFGFLGSIFRKLGRFCGLRTSENPGGFPPEAIIKKTNNVKYT